MKVKNTREHLAEAVSMMPVEEQQAEREALKAGRVTPNLAAALALLAEESAEARGGLAAPATSSAEYTALLAEVRALKAAVEKKVTPAAPAGMSEEEKHEVRSDLRSIEDRVRNMRLSTFKALGVVLLLGCIAGGVIGWHACIEYHTRGAQTVEAE